MGAGVREPTPAELAASPRARTAALLELAPESDVAAWCAGLLTGTASWSEPDRPPAEWVGGRSMAAFRERGLMEDVNAYWLRVWGARVLLYAWDDAAAPAVVGGLSDEAWRVREMSAKVALLRDLGQAGDALAALAEDEVPRVRKAVARALGALGEAEHADALRELCSDEETSVAAAAQKAFVAMERRLDRELWPA